MKYYAVKEGYHPGIYNTWDECKKEVNGYSGAVYKSFKTLEEAENFIHKKKEIPMDGIVAYVDGSFNAKTQVYGYGCIIIKDDEVIGTYLGSGSDPDYVSMRNVSGEIFGSLKAMEYACKWHYKSLTIFYDYEGIEKWADGSWKANKPGTIAYQQAVKEYRKKLKIGFLKVMAHTGDFFNEEADRLAKEACGISK